MDLQMFVKSLIGFFIVFIIQILSKGRYYVLSALIPLFPSMAIFSYYFVAKQRGPDKLQETIVFGMLSLIVYFSFLLSTDLFKTFQNRDRPRALIRYLVCLCYRANHHLELLQETILSAQERPSRSGSEP